MAALETGDQDVFKMVESALSLIGTRGEIRTSLGVQTQYSVFYSCIIYLCDI